MTRVRVRDLCLFGYHGVLPEENRLGQRFIVSLEVAADLTAAMEGDNYEHAVCYGQLSDVAHEIVTGPAIALIETVADRIARTILERFPKVEEVRVEVRKPSVPLPYAVSETSAEVVVKRQHRIGFSVGSNSGEREACLHAAVNALARHEGVGIEQVSSLYDTAPWGVEDQASFINLCAVGKTVLAPQELLNVCKHIEYELGRIPGRRWGERAVDIDLLFYDDCEIDNSVLKLPHRHLFERAFVLEPLAELAPEMKISGRRVDDALARLQRAPGDVTRRMS
nr:2-amino-4-hydroxy-6-hydroxymethyldihydropteridine diphosphokinase [Saccharibacter sp. 17.LH.SD]